MRRFVAGVLAALALAFVATSASVAATHDAASDFRAHPHVRDEWWRLTVHLRDRTGHRFDVTATFFRFVLGGRTFFPASVAFVDEDARRTIAAERMERGDLGTGAAATTHLDVRCGPWTLARLGRELTLRLRADGASAVLRATARTPPFLETSATVVGRFADEPALVVRGTFAFAGAPRPVRGVAWLEHVAGSPPEGARAARGWQRFELQLDDGRDILIARSQPSTEAPEPRRSTAYLVEHGGATRRLRDDEYGLEVYGQSSRAPSGARYPDIWWFRSEPLDLQLSLEPVVPAQELGFPPAGVPYFDGAVDLYDVRPWSLGLRVGSGYVQLVGSGARPRL